MKIAFGLWNAPVFLAVSVKAKPKIKPWLIFKMPLLPVFRLDAI
jgi:hypothetical protein